MVRSPVLPLLAAAATPTDLYAARTQMALSLGWHIVVACLGVGGVWPSAAKTIDPVTSIATAAISGAPRRARCSTSPA